MRIIPLKVENQKEAKKAIVSLGATREGAKILSSKAVFRAFKIEGIKSWEANIIKQHLLSLGSDAAIERDALVKDIETGVLLFGSVSQLRKLSTKLKNQTKRLRLVSEKLSRILLNLERKQYEYRARGKVIKIKEPVVCGIVNITEDSFSGDGLLKEREVPWLNLKELVLGKVSQMIKAGAKIIDIGAESTRPFSQKISSKKELKRIIPILRVVRKAFPREVISVDTYKPQVAEAAVEEGADMINDITALASPRIVSLVKRFNLGCVLMHMRGNPQNMQVNPSYNCVSEEVFSFFRERLDYCQKKGISKSQILIDPGIGFGKLKKHNAEIINKLYQLKAFGVPVFIGISRKSFLGEITKKKSAERLGATIAANMLALARGADVLRVHDVEEARETIKVFSAISSFRSS